MAPPDPSPIFPSNSQFVIVIYFYIKIVSIRVFSVDKYYRKFELSLLITSDIPFKEQSRALKFLINVDFDIFKCSFVFSL